MSAVPLDSALLNKLAEDVMFGPQSDHSRIRHAALLALTKAYVAGYQAAAPSRPEEPKP